MMSDKELLEKYGWSLNCESPFEISHDDGSFARHLPARLLIDHLREEELEELEEARHSSKVKPLSPSEITIELPGFVIETINEMIKKKYRGSSFSFKAKELIALGRSKGRTGSNKDWYAEKWMDFEEVYRNQGWKVRYEQSSYGDSNFDAYYEFTPKK